MGPCFPINDVEFTAEYGAGIGQGILGLESPDQPFITIAKEVDASGQPLIRVFFQTQGPIALKGTAAQKDDEYSESDFSESDIQTLQSKDLEGPYQSSFSNRELFPAESSSSVEADNWNHFTSTFVDASLDARYLSLPMAIDETDHIPLSTPATAYTNTAGSVFDHPQHFQEPNPAIATPPLSSLPLQHQQLLCSGPSSLPPSPSERSISDTQSTLKWVHDAAVTRARTSTSSSSTTNLVDPTITDSAIFSKYKTTSLKSLTTPDNFDPKRTLPCRFEGCTKRFARKYHLQIHEDSHKPKSHLPLTCLQPGCGAQFGRQHDPVWQYQNME